MDYGTRFDARKILRLIFALLVCASLIVFGLYIYTRFQARGSGQLSKAFAQNIRNPYRSSNTEIRFYTGHGFASLNTETLTTTRLGASRVFPESLSQLHFTSGGAAIQAGQYSFFDDLGKEVSGDQLGLSSKDSRLWYVPFIGKIIPIDHNVSSSYADPQTDQIYYTTWNNITQKGEIRTLRAGERKSRLLSSRALLSGLHRIVYAAGDEVFFLDKSNVTGSFTTLKKLSGNSVSVVADNVFGSGTIGVVGAIEMPSSEFFVAVKSGDETSQLVRYDVATRQESVLIEDFEGTLNISSGMVIINGVAGNKLYAASADKSDFDTNITIDQPKGNFTSSFPLAANEFIALNSTAQAMILTSQKTIRPLPEIKSGGLERVINKDNQGRIYDLSIRINNAATTNSYNLNVYQPYDKNIQTFFTDVAAAGYDANQLNILINKTYQTQN